MIKGNISDSGREVEAGGREDKGHHLRTEHKKWKKVAGVSFVSEEE